VFLLSSKKKIIIIGSGPAGLTAAFELLLLKEYDVTLLEETEEFGGISRTVCHNGNRMDIGGHRFFSKNEEIMNWWKNLMPLQGAPSKDDLLLGRQKPIIIGGPDPETTDTVMLIRERVSRIYYLRKFFDYPISLKIQTFINMGLTNTVTAGMSYIRSAIFKRPETSLEDFFINRFGKVLYKMFFENYTEKVWGRHPSQISADWGAQRVKGLSLLKVLKDIVSKPFRKKNDVSQKEIETSLIEQFIYPKHGPGQLWETVAAKVCGMGGEILTGCRVIKLNASESEILSVTCDKNGEEKIIYGDVFLSSMPVRDLVLGIEGIAVPKDVFSAASELPYRDFITVGLLVNKLNLKNETNIKTVSDIVPDCWIYIQEPDVKVGRLQIFNNWSPYMVADLEGTVWVGLEYFVNEGDKMWNMSDEENISLAKDELHKIGIIDKKDVKDSVRVRVKKAYPAYFDGYKDFDKIRSFLDGYSNLYCIGRNGQHRYNNMDHSMLTAMEAVNNIHKGISTKNNIWSVNSDEEYHETKK